jgi:serine/threonine kinase 16
LKLATFVSMQEGNMWDYVERRGKENDPLTLAEVLHVFIQLCHALKAMHTAQPPIAHRDVKPHNILWTDSRKEGGKDASRFTDGSLDSAHFVARASDNSLTANDYNHPNNTSIKVVLMDFGSAGQAPVQVDGRSEALALQEDAERHCTAPYRAPELWDVASSCTISEKIDVWSAGCVLYYLMVGQSPFEKTASEAGGSLMLAIVNGQYTWPDEVKKRYPPAMRDVVAACLEVNPAVRPSIDQICSVVERLIDETC